VRIGVFGGSFDPIHNAHMIVARLALEQLGLDRVLFTVAASQPLKAGQHVAAANHRLRMVELAVAGLPDFVADSRELRRPGPSYTIDTLRELAAEHAGAELVLIMGADVASGFGAWREPEGVRRLARIAVCHRAALLGSGAVHAGVDALRDFDAGITVPVLEISSTMIRARAAAGASVAGWVPQPVADYIVASQLYVE
jgi:nicotinate-nucleotide adenylyltransferase